VAADGVGGGAMAGEHLRATALVDARQRSPQRLGNAAERGVHADQLRGCRHGLVARAEAGLHDAGQRSEQEDMAQAGRGGGFDASGVELRGDLIKKLQECTR